jgi:hypothetical protein
LTPDAALRRRITQGITNVSTLLLDLHKRDEVNSPEDKSAKMLQLVGNMNKYSDRTPYGCFSNIGRYSVIVGIRVLCTAQEATSAGPGLTGLGLH